MGMVVGVQPFEPHVRRMIRAREHYLESRVVQLSQPRQTVAAADDGHYSFPLHTGPRLRQEKETVNREGQGGSCVFNLPIYRCSR